MLKLTCGNHAVKSVCVLYNTDVCRYAQFAYVTLSMGSHVSLVSLGLYYLGRHARARWGDVC